MKLPFLGHRYYLLLTLFFVIFEYQYSNYSYRSPILISSLLRNIKWPSRKTEKQEPLDDIDFQKFTLEQYETINPTANLQHEGRTVTYCTPNRATKWRVDTLYTKEPDTLEWISGFSEDDVLLDIGANVGMYTIWAAITR